MLPFLSIWQPYNSVNLCNLARKVATFSVGSRQRGRGISKKKLPLGKGPGVLKIFSVFTKNSKEFCFFSKNSFWGE